MGVEGRGRAKALNWDLACLKNQGGRFDQTGEPGVNQQVTPLEDLNREVTFQRISLAKETKRGRAAGSLLWLRSAQEFHWSSSLLFHVTSLCGIALSTRPGRTRALPCSTDGAFHWESICWASDGTMLSSTPLDRAIRAGKPRASVGGLCSKAQVLGSVWGGGHQWHQPAPVCPAAPATARLHPGPPKTSRITVPSRYGAWSPLFYGTQKGPVWVRPGERGSCCCRGLLSAPQHRTFHSIGQVLDIPLRKEACTLESLVHSNLKCSPASVPMYL